MCAAGRLHQVTLAQIAFVPSAADHKLLGQHHIAKAEKRADFIGLHHPIEHHPDRHAS